jgi:hypothetical protein
MSSNRPTSSTVRPPCILVNGGWCRCFPGGRRSPAHRRGRAAATSLDAARHERNERAGVEAECTDVVEAGTAATTRMPHRLCRVLAGRSRLQPARDLRNCLLQPVIPGRSRPWPAAPYRPVTPEAAGSIPVAPVFEVPGNRDLSIVGALARDDERTIGPASSGPIPNGLPPAAARYGTRDARTRGPLDRQHRPSRSAHRPRPIRETGGDADAATRSCGP